MAAAYAGPSISAKKAEAQRVLAQLQALDSSAMRANSRYEEATRKLQLVKQELSVNRQALGVARVNLVRSRHALEQRLVVIYTSQEQQSSLAVILGAKSLGDLIARLETVNTVTNQDTSLIEHVVSYQHQIVRRRTTLRRARVAQRHLVAVRAAAKRSIDARLAQERRLYASVRSQISQLEAQRSAAQLAAARRAQASSQIYGQLGTGVIGGETHSQVVSIALQYLGVPYVWGGESPSGFDCSGLVAYVYAQVGINLPHYTVAQWNYPGAVYVPRSQLQPGDLVFFDGLGHVGIYIGGNKFIHAPHTGAVVSIDSLTGWYSQYYVGAKRIP